MDRVATPIDRADFTTSSPRHQAPPWERTEQRRPGPPRAIGEESPSPGADPRALDVEARARDAQGAGPARLDRVPEAKRLLGAAANSRGYRHEENVKRLVHVAGEMPLPVGSALLASADGYTPRANSALDHAREELGTVDEIANALADNLPAPKLTARKSRRRRRKRKGTPPTGAPATDGAAAETPADPIPLARAEPACVTALVSPVSVKTRPSRDRRTPASRRRPRARAGSA